MPETSARSAVPVVLESRLFEEIDHLLERKQTAAARMPRQGISQRSLPVDHASLGVSALVFGILGSATAFATRLVS